MRNVFTILLDVLLLVIVLGFAAYVWLLAARARVALRTERVREMVLTDAFEERLRDVASRRGL